MSNMSEKSIFRPAAIPHHSRTRLAPAAHVCDGNPTVKPLFSIEVQSGPVRTWRRRLDRTDTTGASPAPTRLADRIGIVTRLLAGAVLAMLLAVVSVQLWTLRSVEANGLQRAQQALGVAMAVLQQNLAPFGSTWSTTPDGELLLGTTPLNGRNDLVDAVRDVTGASVTIFLADTRIATNIKNPDGSRGVGTKLAAGPAHDAALRDGQAYTGPATILGQPYLAIYQPIRNARAETVGILFVGVPLTEAEAFMGRIIREAVLGTVVIALVAGFGYLLTLRATIRPLGDLTSVMHRIAGGELDSTVPCTSRKDQIGKMALALLQLRDASARARMLEAAAAARARPNPKNMPPCSAWLTGSRPIRHPLSPRSVPAPRP